ncbi:MAG: TonB-dependent receptor SusC [Ferruginibacter sp.]|nr:TonB-dependent receptor SusC [Ferruginibacter sp.]
MFSKQQKELFMRHFFLFIFLALSTASFAQDKQLLTISGTVKDAATGETLIGASIVLTDVKPKSTFTNAYGFYSINAIEGTYKMSVSFIGYVTDTITIVMDKSQQLLIGLQFKQAQLATVIISSKRKNENISRPIMGVDKLNMTEMNKIPVIFGEKDILKAIQLMPGYKGAGEGNSGLNVRGGGTDQNLILLDEAPVYNASHLLGFFSTFNSDAIKDVSVYKGGMPAQYGGRLSSVIDVKMKDGNQKKLSIEGGLGTIASRINVSAPIVKDKGSFIISARRTYADVYLSLLKDTGQGKKILYFYDLNLKANYKVSKKDRVFLSGYFGRDDLGLGKEFSTDWGNKTATLRWNHVFGNSLFSNTSLVYSNFDYKIGARVGIAKFSVVSKVEDFNIKQDFDWNITNKSKLRFGGNFINHTIAPGAVTEANAGGIAKPVQTRYSQESALYVSHEWKTSDKIEIVYGLRVSNLAVKGAGNFNTYDKSRNIISTTGYAKGKTVISYFNLEPRFSASYKLNELTSIKASYNRNVQNLHLITNATTSSPTDVWLPSSNNIRPEIADQYAIGFYKNSKEGMFEFTTEVYYKALQNQIDYRNAAVIFGNDNVESELLYGAGRAYGLELMMRKKTGRLTGWVGYTLSKAQKKIDGINNGNYFNARQDRTHDISIVGMYDVNKRWSVSATWVYTTGSAVTFPTGKYEVNGQTVFLYSDRNDSRFPAYHQLDLAATLEARKNKNRRYQSSWTFGLYNAYGRQNAYTINFRENKDDPSKTEAVRTSLFSIIPSATWNFKF